VVSFFPGDFRTAGQLKQTLEENLKLGSAPAARAI
jgi:hypothetical protein